MVARVITKATAAPIPMDVSTFLETPRNGHIPRNCEKMMLLTNIAEININKYSMIQMMIIMFFVIVSIIA
jgi:hypothetical protein